MTIYFYIFVFVGYFIPGKLKDDHDKIESQLLEIGKRIKSLEKEIYKDD